MADVCGLKKCGWIVSKTDPPELKDFSTAPGNTLDKNGDGDFVRRAIATILGIEPSGIVETPDPELPQCATGCVCRPIGKRPTKDEDFGDPWDQPVIVKISLHPEQGSPLVEVIGHVKKRMMELPGRCYHSVSKG